MIDRAASALLLLAVALLAIGWLVSGRARYERVARGGSSVFLGAGAQNAGYWGLQPLARALTRLGLSANAITLASLPLAAAAALAFATRHYGIGTWLALAGFACDALDGLVARATRTASDSGEVLDAVVDRVCEALLFGGLTYAWRDAPVSLIVVLAAALGAQQVTLATAKSEVFPRARVPRGAMRRAERAALLLLGAAISGLTHSEWPLVAALALMAVVANASASYRFFVLARALRRPEAAHDVELPHAAE